MTEPMEYVNSLNMHQVQYRKRTIVIKNHFRPTSLLDGS